MLIVPYGTDAPVYHRPWATGGLIAVNILAFATLPADELLLEWGNGLHPIQWVTANFAHIDVFHLLGNMAFLWVLGLIVEGKVGSAWYLAIYLGIGVVACGLLQAAMLGADEGGALGASMILFGLLAIALVWAPANDVKVFYWVWFWFWHVARTATLSIRVFAVLFLIWEALGAALTAAAGFGVGSSAFHLLGAAVGLPIGIGAVKKNLVDCEGWDIFSLRYGKPTRRSEGPEEAEEPEEERAVRVATEREEALDLIRRYLAEGDAEMARTVYTETVNETGPWELPKDALGKWIDVHERAGTLDEAKSLLREYLERFPGSARMKILLAGVYLEKEERPSRALEILEDLEEGLLPEDLRSERERLIEAAEKLRAAGALELDLDD